MVPMFPHEDGRLFNERIEAQIDALVDAIHYSSGGAFGTNGHSVIIAECVTCGDLYHQIRSGIAEVIL